MDTFQFLRVFELEGLTELYFGLLTLQTSLVCTLINCDYLNSCCFLHLIVLCLVNKHQPSGSWLILEVFFCYCCKHLFHI